jgi:FkbM family methyltransferase
MRPSTIYLGEGRALTRTVHDHLMFVLARDLSLAPWLMLDGIWEPATTEVFLRLVQPGMTVVDAGANVGYFTLLAARAVGERGRVHAFEPDPELFELLSDNVEVNGYTGRVTLHRAALGAAAGRTTFHATKRHRGNGSVIARLDQLGDNRGETRTFDVDVTTIDGCGLERVDLLKVDAEGSEPWVFRGAAATIARSGPMSAVVEFWPSFFAKAGEDARRFLEERRREGFTLERIDGERAHTVAVEIDELLARGPSELVLRRR